MKKYLPIITFLVYLLHFMAFYFFGIATFSTTLLLYYFIYLTAKWIIKILPDYFNKYILLNNLRIIIFLCLLMEFSATFIFKIANIYSENEKGIYLSRYKYEEQLKLLHFLGKKELNNPWQNGHLPFEITKNISTEFNYPIKMNKLGLRGKLPAIIKKEYRILTLGDSYIEGFGVKYDSLTFAALLEKKLRINNANISVINGGIAGSNPYYSIDLYYNKLKELSPDLVLLSVNIGDLEDIQFISSQSRIPLKEYFYATSHLYRVLNILFFRDNLINENTSDKIKRKREVVTKNLLLAILQFNNELKADKKHLVVIYIPSLHEFTNQMTPTDYLYKSIINSSLSVIDLKNIYKERFINIDSIKEYYWPKDGHYNEKGYNLMAETVKEELQIDSCFTSMPH